MQSCKNCKTGRCVKAGLQANGKQKWKCKICFKYQQSTYSYQGYVISDEIIKRFIAEGVGLRSMSRLLRISCTTIIKRIRAIAKDISPPPLFKANQVYEVDEMHTFIFSKVRECWITYAIERTTKQVVDFRTGGRTKGKGSTLLTVSGSDSIFKVN